MPVVNLYATFRDLAGQSRVEVPGRTVGEALSALVKRYPGLEAELFENRALAERATVFLGGRDVRYLQGLDTPLAEEDVLDLFPPVAGGQVFRRVYGALRPWLLEAYLKGLGARKEGEVFHLPGAQVRFRELPPHRVGSLEVPQLEVEVEGPEALRWFEKLELYAARGGG
jgi:molybdopterin synthase sulfur carrier subunit